MKHLNFEFVCVHKKSVVLCLCVLRESEVYWTTLPTKLCTKAHAVKHENYSLFLGWFSENVQFSDSQVSL